MGQGVARVERPAATGREAALSGTGRRGGALRASWRAFRRHPAALLGTVVLLLLIAVAAVGPRLAPYAPDELGMAVLLVAPDRAHPFGTDQYGRDVLTRVLYGAHLSLGMGLISVAIGATLGGLLGLLAGYFGRWVDILIMRLIDIQLAFPGILLAMGIVAVLGPSLQNAMIAVGLASIPGYARVLRGAVLSAKELTYVESARAAGCPHTRIMFRHIFPNVLAPLIVLATLGVPSAILTASGLSFIGLGAQPPTPEWGAMLNDGRQYLDKAWWLTTFPGLAIMLAVLAINLLGDGLRDALDPRYRD
ncbi:MAG TPA: ABC transporter permease [Thermomicrobiales bacterium]|nr:ABC transporter permease [Thermomicrobiales bacterium]